MDWSVLRIAGPVYPITMLLKCSMLIIGAERSYDASDGYLAALTTQFFVSPKVLLLQSAGVHLAPPSMFTELRFGLTHKKDSSDQDALTESLTEHEKRLP